MKGTAPDDDDHRCNVRRARWISRGGGLLFEIEADRFLHHMVRNLVGTFLLVGKGGFPEAFVSQIIAARSRSAAGPTAPASGLFLINVEY